MPRNYQNGKIYTISSRSRPDLIYVGSTIQSLSTRFGMHKKPSNDCSSKQIIALSDSYIELLETYPCQNIEELQRRENYHMRSIDCVNKKLAIDDCPHGRIHAYCKDCHGASICDHNRLRIRCKDCHGSSICEHDRERINCKICEGSQICEHNRRRQKCKDCKGSSICSHDKRKEICKDCKGSSICEHNRAKETCKDCGGISVCEHNLQRIRCKACSPRECDFCNIITSKGDFKRHLKTKKHKDNYEAELLRVSEIEITDADVPQF